MRVRPENARFPDEDPSWRSLRANNGGSSGNLIQGERWPVFAPLFTGRHWAGVSCAGPFPFELTVEGFRTSQISKMRVYTRVSLWRSKTLSKASFRDPDRKMLDLQAVMKNKEIVKLLCREQKSEGRRFESGNASGCGLPPENTRGFKVGSFTERRRTDESEPLQRGANYRGAA